MVRTSGLSHPNGSLTMLTSYSTCRILLEDMRHPNSSEHQNSSSSSALLKYSVSVYLKPCRGSMSIQILIGNIITEFEYPGCTMSVITGLAIFKKRYLTYRTKRSMLSQRRPSNTYTTRSTPMVAGSDRGVFASPMRPCSHWRDILYQPCCEVGVRIPSEQAA